MADETTPLANNMQARRYLRKKKKKVQDEETFPDNPALQAELDEIDSKEMESLRKRSKLDTAVIAAMMSPSSKKKGK